MPDTSALPVRPRLDARAWALIIPAGVIVVGLLVGILLVLNTVRVQLTEQNQRTRLLIEKADPTLRRAPSALDRAQPLLRDAAPVLEASRKAIPEARRAARDGRELLEATKKVFQNERCADETASRHRTSSDGPTKATSLRRAIG